MAGWVGPQTQVHFGLNIWRAEPGTGVLLLYIHTHTHTYIHMSFLMNVIVFFKEMIFKKMVK